MMYDELDQLKKLTRSIELAPIVEASEDNDLDAEVIDGTMGNEAYENGNPIFYAKINGSKNDCLSKCSGTPGKHKKVLEPIFENPDDTEENTDEMVQECLSLGLGKGAGLSLKAELNESCETVCDDEGCKFNVGDIVKMADCDDDSENPMVILIVKSCDGPTITTAKPTRNEDELVMEKDGCWPEFTCSPDEICKMEGVSKKDVYAIMDFNDAQMESFEFPATAMDRARNIAEENQRDKELDESDIKNKLENGKTNKMDESEIKERLDDICGGIQYTATSPTVVVKKPDGSVQATKKVATWGSSTLEF